MILQASWFPAGSANSSFRMCCLATPSHLPSLSNTHLLLPTLNVPPVFQGLFQPKTTFSEPSGFIGSCLWTVSRPVPPSCFHPVIKGCSSYLPCGGPEVASWLVVLCGAFHTAPHHSAWEGCSFSLHSQGSWGSVRRQGLVVRRGLVASGLHLGSTLPSTAHCLLSENILWSHLFMPCVYSFLG